MEGEYKEACRKKIMQVALRLQTMTYELERICGLFEKNGIYHMPLKGAVIRNLYPEPWMRNSCDVDILIKSEDLQPAIKLLSEEFDYVEKKKTACDVVMQSESGIHIEIHFNLLEDDVKKNGKYLRKWNFDCLLDVWNSSEPENGKKYCMKMSDELFYFYHIAHMAKHFESGGCGIRALIDLWILNTTHDCNRLKRLEYLKKGKLDVFESQMLSLCESWFAKKPYSDVSVLLENYIISGGAYGAGKNSVAYDKSKLGNSGAYAKNRIWVSEDLLRKYYPALEKKPWLMPFCQMGRWIKIISKGHLKRSVRELKMNYNLSVEMLSEVSELIKKLEI